MSIDIVCVKSTQNRCFVGSRLFELPELKLLVDAVESSHLITRKKSASLIQKLAQFRVDRMTAVELLWQPAIPAQDFDPAMYVRQVFGMFGADIQRIKLLCENSATRSMVDRFGEEIQTEVVDEEHFQATVDVAPSPPFFAWVFTFGGKIRIMEPEEVATKMGELARWLY